MLKQIFLLILVTLFFINCFSQKATVTCDKFFELLNSYDKLGLQNLLSDDFKLKRGFANYENDKTSFLGKYLAYSKEINAKFIVLSVKSENEIPTYLVQDESDYLKYLEIKAPILKISFTNSNDGKIEIVQIDTTKSFEIYRTQMKEKDKLFENWIKKKYKNSKDESLITGKGVSNLLKEYFKSRKK